MRLIAAVRRSASAGLSDLNLESFVCSGSDFPGVKKTRDPHIMLISNRLDGTAVGMSYGIGLAVKL